MSDAQAAIEAVLKLNPHRHAHSKARWVPERDRFEFPIVKKPLTREWAAWHVRGKGILGAVGADEHGYTNTVGLDLDAHFAAQNPARAACTFIRTAQVADVPVIVHSSKSGKGAHIRTLFRESVPTYLARALYIALVLAAGLSGEKAVDKVWPPSHGLGVLALPYNAQCAQASGGSLALDCNTLRPLDRDAQASAVLDAPELSRDETERTLKALGIHTDAEAALLSGQARSRNGWTDGTRTVKNGTDGGIQEMMKHCAAVERLRLFPTEATYEFWFSLMTNFRPFIGGAEIFTALSQLDPERFDKRVLDRSWKAIAGGPRLCEHLDSGWTCPKRAFCPARSPAGLPFAVRRAQRERDRDAGGRPGEHS